MKLKCIYSGGQTGVDFSAWLVAKHFNFITGGWMPKGFKNQNGYHPEYAVIFGAIEHPSSGYKERTWANVRDSDATIRLAGDFRSAGEIVTLNGIKKYDKPYFDVDLADPCPIQNVVDWIRQNNIETLNIAGNAESTYKGAESESAIFLIKLFEALTISPESSH